MSVPGDYSSLVANPFGKILLITGATSAAEFVAERTQERALAAVTSARPDVEITRARGGDLAAGELATVTSPSLFSEATALLVTGLEGLGEVPADELLEFAASPHADIAVVLVHGGGNKGKRLLDGLRKLASVDEVKLEVPKYDRDFAGWVKNESRERGRSLDEAAADLLVTAVGHDLRALAAAVDQLAATLDAGQQIDHVTVSRYFGGRAEVRGYEIADAALEGRLAEALEKARWAETARVAPVLVTSAVATAIRQLALLAGAPAGLRDGELASHVGVPPFKLRTLRRLLSSWTPAGISRALEAVAVADREVKGSAADPHYAVERMLISVTAARRR